MRLNNRLGYSRPRSGNRVVQANAERFKKRKRKLVNNFVNRLVNTTSKNSAMPNFLDNRHRPHKRPAAIVGGRVCKSVCKIVCKFSTDGNLSSAMPSRPWVGRGRSTTEKKIAERGATAKKNKGR